MQWIESLVGAQYAPIASLFLFVFALILVAMVFWTFISRLSQPRAGSGRRSQKARLAVTDAASVDSRRRLVLIRRDEVEHLVMIGGPLDLVIESEIGRDGAGARAGGHQTPLPVTAPSRQKPVQPEEPAAERKKAFAAKSETGPDDRKTPSNGARAPEVDDARPLPNPRQPATAFGGEEPVRPSPAPQNRTQPETASSLQRPVEKSSRPAPVPATPPAPASPVTPAPRATGSVTNTASTASPAAPALSNGSAPSPATATRPDATQPRPVPSPANTASAPVSTNPPSTIQPGKPPVADAAPRPEGGSGAEPGAASRSANFEKVTSLSPRPDRPPTSD